MSKPYLAAAALAVAVAATPLTHGQEVSTCPVIYRDAAPLNLASTIGPVLLDPANGVLVARAHLRAPGATGATPPPQVDRPAVTARLLSGEQRRRGRQRVALRSADVERALVMLRRAVRPGGSCDAYFRALGVDPEALLSLGEPPYLIYLDGNRFAGEGICAKAQAGEPFSYVFLNPDCPLDGKDTCAVASLLLHEMGHLARRDITDNEPPEFFEACRVGCVRPGDFY